MSTIVSNTSTPQKKTKSRKNKKADGVSTPIDEQSIKATPEPTETPQDSGLKQEKEALKELSKREKKLKKKITLIEASEEKIKDLSEEEKASTRVINADERRKISEKPIHLAVLKELTEVVDIVTRADAAEEKRIANEKAQLAAAHAEELKAAKEEGRREAEAKADDNLRLLLTFLRTVSVRRAATANQPTESGDTSAFETALIAVYEGSEKGFTACQNLFNGLDEPVKEAASTWARIKQLCCEEIKPTPESHPAPAAEISDPATESNESPENSQETQATGEVPTQETILENETTEDGYIIVPTTQETLPPPPAAASIDESAANAAAEYPTETGTEVAATETAPITATDAPAETLTGGSADATQKGIEEAPKTNGEFRQQEGRGRGGRGHYRGRSDYRGEGYRGRGGYRGDHRGGHRGGEHRNGEHRGEHRREHHGEHRGENRGEHRGGELRGGETRGEGNYREGRGGYGGGRGGDRPYRGRGEGYSGGRGDGYRGGYRGRGGFANQNNQQTQPQQPPAQTHTPPPPPPQAQAQSQA